MPSLNRGRPELVEFGRRVRERRHALGLTQEQLAERCGLHPTYIGGIERGERNSAVLAILKVARGLDVDPGELLQGMR